VTTKLEIAHAFNRSAYNYDSAAKIQTEIGKRLIQRLDYIKLKPKTILDLGCATATFSRYLKKRFPKAKIISVDISYEMLKRAKNKQRWWRNRYSLCNADMESLPFKAQSFDLVFSNQVVHWADSLTNVFNEVNRILRHDGLFLFSTLGPDTFIEIRQAWSNIDKYAHVNHFIDMHDVGDELLRSSFHAPVIDMEAIVLKYSNHKALISSLQAQGVKNIQPERRKGLTGKNTWQQFVQSYNKSSDEDNKLPLTYEVVYGHAWKVKGEEKTNEISFPISEISILSS
jgi:malonyl-CoA O-methyltransferase